MSQAQTGARRAGQPTLPSPGVRRPNVRIRLLSLTVLGALVLTGCRDSNNPDAAASSVVSHLGAVPIPTASGAQPTPTASAGHLQLVAIGAPVRVRLAHADAVVTALGPQELTPYTGGPSAPTSTVGIITITVAPTRGSLRFTSTDFASADETGKVVTLEPDGAASVTASAGHPARLRIQGRFTSGAAQVTWRHAGAVLIVWDFNVELD